MKSWKMDWHGACVECIKECESCFQWKSFKFQPVRKNEVDYNNGKNQCFC